MKRITFNPTSANPGETLFVHVPKLAVNEVIVPGSLALVFDINLKVTGAHANNYLVQNVSRALVDKFVVRFAATTVQETLGTTSTRSSRTSLSPLHERANMLPEGIQSLDLCKIRSGAGDKKTSGVDEENALNAVYGTKYRINLDHPILTDHGVFYPQALYSDLVFELTLAPAGQVVNALTPPSSGTSWKKSSLNTRSFEARLWLTRRRARTTVARSSRTTSSCVKGVVPITRGSDTRLTIRVNPQRRSLKGLLLLFINPYNPGARDSEHYFNPDITKVTVTVNGGAQSGV